MLRRIFAFMAAAALTVCLAGCSDYVMTEEDLAIYKSIQGCWAADVGTGYNEFDENGNLTAMIVVEFTDDFHYLMHICYLDERYALSYPPVKYSFEDKMFKVETNGVASYAQLSVSDDGQTLYWHTDDKTDTYLKISKEEATNLGVPEYSPEAWVTDENGEFVSESAAVSGSESDLGTEAPVTDSSAADSSDTEASDAND
ncbi:MAG: hypothetical protein HFJ89_08020 [Oscillospiraceae bacterium]|jgi:hypothetical protein|nr:hypothetical protein [Oscillospiraceae bacterium]